MTPPAVEPFAFTILQLGNILRYARTGRLGLMLPPLNASLPAGQIDSRRRGAMFIAQLAHESGEFRYLEEIADGHAYEGRADLGNIEPGDGKRFKGRGVIQITGRNRYQRAADALGLPLVFHPEIASLPENAFRIASWFWRHAPDKHGVEHDLNNYADDQDLEGCTRIIDGGLNGLDFRMRYYELAKDVLGVGRSYA